MILKAFPYDVSDFVDVDFFKDSAQIHNAIQIGVLLMDDFCQNICFRNVFLLDEIRLFVFNLHVRIIALKGNKFIFVILI